MVIKKVEILRAACCIAGLDQEITEDEEKMILRIAEYAGVGSASVQAMKNRAIEDPNFFEELFENLKTDADNTMKILFSVACADKELQTDERVVLYHFAQRLGLSDERFNKLMAAAVKKTSE